MPQQPYHKMIIELDGQEAELIIRSLQISILNASCDNEELKRKMSIKLLNSFIHSKTQFHNEWKKYLLSRSEGKMEHNTYHPLEESSLCSSKE